MIKPTISRGLKALVADYKKAEGDGEWLKKNLDTYTKLDWEVAIWHAAYGDYMGDNGKWLRQPHQKGRITHELLKTAANETVKLARDLANCRNFEEMYQLVNTVKHEHKGLGALWAYDTTFRIAHCKGFKPTKIAMQCGTAIGARSMGVKAKKGWAEVSQFPIEITSQLTPYEIENFLCIKRRQIRELYQTEILPVDFVMGVQNKKRERSS